MPMIIKGGKRYCTSSNLAEDIIYNNKISELKATNVQDAIDELDADLGGFSFYNNPEIIFQILPNSIYYNTDGKYVLSTSEAGIALLEDEENYTSTSIISLVTDNTIYIKEDGNYVLAESEEGIALLADASMYSSISVVMVINSPIPYEDENKNYILASSSTGIGLLADINLFSNIIKGSFYRIVGADSVIPFKNEGGKEEYRLRIIAALQNSNFKPSEDATWEDIINGLIALYPEFLDLKALGVVPLRISGSSRETASHGGTWYYKNSKKFDITNFRRLVYDLTLKTNNGARAKAWLRYEGGSEELFSGSKEIDVSSYTGEAYFRVGHAQVYHDDGDGVDDADDWTSGGTAKLTSAKLYA